MGEAKRRLRKLGLVAVAVCLLAATAQAATEYCIEKDIALYGNLDQDDIPGIGVCACGPTAAVNSFVYLQNAYPNVYDSLLVPGQGQDLDNDGDVDSYDDMIAAAQALGAPGYMNTKCPGGTWDDMFIYGKYQYIVDNAPGSTVFAAELSSTWGWAGQRPPDEIPPIDKPDWVAQNTTPTWQFIFNNLVACEDVEILINEGDWGHFLTVTSFCWTDADDDGIIDPEESAALDYVDPCNGGQGLSPIWQESLGGPILISYGTFSRAQITMAVKESPIPEPLTVLGVMLGVSSLAAYIRRRRLSA
jgi:hypothetical protein